MPVSLIQERIVDNVEMTLVNFFLSELRSAFNNSLWSRLSTHRATVVEETSERTVEQIADGREDVDADILRHEKVLHGYQANTDHCVQMLKAKKEDLEQYEKKEAALLARERREWQRVVDENKVLIPHHRQVVQTTKEKLANLMREVQEKRE